MMKNYLVSPADGLVLQVEDLDGPKELNLEGKKFKKVSIFMNVFDCHVNRTPCSGKVTEILYKPGKFLNASLDKASEDNERNYYKISNSSGEDINCCSDCRTYSQKNSDRSNRKYRIKTR